jgi:hypothetical protein
MPVVHDSPVCVGHALECGQLSRISYQLSDLFDEEGSRLDRWHAFDLAASLPMLDCVRLFQHSKITNSIEKYQVRWPDPAICRENR